MYSSKFKQNCDKKYAKIWYNVCYAEKLTKCISIFTTVFGHLFCVTDVSVKTLKSFSIVKSLRSIFERSCLLRLSFSWYSFQASKSLVVSIYGQLFLSSVQLSKSNDATCISNLDRQSKVEHLYVFFLHEPIQYVSLI